MMLKLNDYADNITLSVVWEDEFSIEVRIVANTLLITVSHNYYLDDELILKLSQYICDYCDGKEQTACFVSGPFTGKYIPAFSFSIDKIDNRGHLYVTLDLELDDVDDRSHRCKCYIKCEIGQLSRFGKRIRKLLSREIGTTISLIDDE